MFSPGRLVVRCLELPSVHLARSVSTINNPWNVPIPFRIFGGPRRRRELSDRVKARPVIANDPGSDWRHVGSMDKLLNNAYHGCETLGDIWDKTVLKYMNAPCMGTRHLLKGREVVHEGGKSLQLELGSYYFDSFYEVNSHVSNVVSWFRKNDLKKGDHVVIFAETRAEWMQTALACFKYGLPVITVYATLGEEAVAFALKECGAKVIFTSCNLLPKVAKALESSPNTIISYYQEQHRVTGSDGWARPEIKEAFKKAGNQLVSFEEVLKSGLEVKGGVIDKPKADDLAMVMYTSGTTGNPKGVMLSHRNIIAAISGQGRVLSVRKDDVCIGYLPLAHILEVCAELVVLSKGARIGYSSVQTLIDRSQHIKPGTTGDCAELRPNLIACVPAVLDRIFKTVTEQITAMNPLVRELFQICYELRRARYKEGYSDKILSRLAFNRIRNLLGGRLRFIISGGAPLNSKTQRFVNICFCCPVVQGYGLTETCGGATLTDESDLTTGAVGPPLRSCEIRLREWKEAGYSPYNKNPQGEILVGGANVALGYYKNEELTKQEFIQIDGKRYFVTGDIGEFRPDGTLMIIDRKKDLIKLAQGEYISLSKVETLMLTHPAVDNICVHGDSEHDYLVGLVVPNHKNLNKIAQDNGISGPWEEICKNRIVIGVLTKELTDWVSEKLTKVETPKKLILCSEPWTSDKGLLTEALKLKRKNIEKAYEKEIDEAYLPKN